MTRDGQSAYGGTEEAQRLRKIASGSCLHKNTVEAWTLGKMDPDVICWDCSEPLPLRADE